MPSRMSEFKCQKDSQTTCQKIFQIECQKECLTSDKKNPNIGQTECQKQCQIERHSIYNKDCQIECESKCQTECQKECPIKWQNVYIYIYICHIEWMSDRMSNRISWFMPERKSNRASEYINISAIYNPRWYVRNCVTIASRVASFEVKIVHVLPLVSQKAVEAKNYIYIYIYVYIWWQYASDCWLTRV